MKRGTLHFDELPESLARHGYPNDIPIQEGQYKLDIDVREDQIDPDVIKSTRGLRDQRLRALHGDCPALNRPLGFNIDEAIQAGGVVVWDSEASD